MAEADAEPVAAPVVVPEACVEALPVMLVMEPVLVNEAMLIVVLRGMEVPVAMPEPIVPTGMVVDAVPLAEMVLLANALELAVEETEADEAADADAPWMVKGPK